MKNIVVPNLKQMQSKVQKRRIWLECASRNRYQNALFEAENDLVHNLIVREKEQAKDCEEEALKYPEEVVGKAY